MDAEPPVFIDLGSGWYIMNETARRIAYTAAKYFAGKYERDAAQEMLDNPTEPKAPAPPDEPAQPPAPADDILGVDVLYTVQTGNPTTGYGWVSTTGFATGSLRGAATEDTTAAVTLEVALYRADASNVSTIIDHALLELL